MENMKIIQILNRKTVANKKAIKAVQEIMKTQFPGLEKELIDGLPYSIFAGRKMGFINNFYVSVDQNQVVSGFVIYSYFPRYNFYFVDYMAAAPNMTGQGIGSKLYEFVRGQAKAKEAVGVFFECLNDDPQQAGDENRLKQNISRLKFYEKYGARPIVNTQYEVKVKPSGNSTLLVFDPLDGPILFSRDVARKIVRKIMQKKYSDYCPPEYIRMVTASFKDNPVLLREPKYIIKV